MTAKTKQGIDWRSKVLAVLRKRNGAMSAYDVLGELRRFNPKIAPPTIYRALTALEKRGQVHRLESMNAFVACRCDRHQLAPVLSVCNHCGLVEEHLSTAVHGALSDLARQSDFVLSHQVIELFGSCVACRGGAGW